MECYLSLLPTCCLVVTKNARFVGWLGLVRLLQQTALRETEEFTIMAFPSGSIHEIQSTGLFLILQWDLSRFQVNLVQWRDSLSLLLHFVLLLIPICFRRLGHCSSRLKLF